MSNSRIISLGLAIVVGFIGLTILAGSWFTVDQGERSVILRNGAFLRVAEPGLGFKFPIIDDEKPISVRVEKRSYPYCTPQEKVCGLASYSKDIQLAHNRVSVNYSIDATMVREVYETYGLGLVERRLDPEVFEWAKTIFGKYTAVEAISQRDRLNADMTDAIRKATVGSGILVQSVNVENVDFSEEYEKSIEQQMKAGVDLLKETTNAEIVRTTANGKADAIRAVAQADADAIRMKGEAEAKAIIARSDALKQNANLIELTKAERWDGKLPTTMMPGSAVPFIGVK